MVESVLQPSIPQKDAHFTNPNLPTPFSTLALKLQNPAISRDWADRTLLDRGYTEAEVPSERTMRDILNRMNYRLKRIQKGKPLKKTEHTDAIFENVKAVRAEAEADPETLEISIDTKTKVKLGEYSLGGKNKDRSRR